MNFGIIKAVAELHEDQLDELVLDAKCQEATSINNDGVDCQLSYLLQSMGSEELLKLLDAEAMIKELDKKDKEDLKNIV
tara:strand:- start:6461 stop:6697 length:237 start_codon:yes stop_codon:yes gene_type:complete